MKIQAITAGHPLEIEFIPGEDGEVYLYDSDHLVPLTLITEECVNHIYVYRFPLCIGGESCCKLVIFHENNKWIWALSRTVELLQEYGVVDK